MARKTDDKPAQHYAEKVAETVKKNVDSKPVVETKNIIKEKTHFKY